MTAELQAVLDAKIEAVWIAEAQRRWEEIRSGRSKTVPLEEVTAKLRSKLESARARASMG